MTNPAIYRLMTWLSPSYPVGAFSYSHGLEWLVEDGSIGDVDSLADWLRFLLRQGSGRNDAILFAAAHRAATAADMEALEEISALAHALASSSERLLETASQGDAFCMVTGQTWQSSTLEALRGVRPEPICYPVAVGTAAADHKIDITLSLEAYLHGFVSNLISAGVRLVPLGHTDGQRVQIALETDVAETVADGLAGDLSDIGSSTFMADIAAMKHETQYTRLFRT